MDYATHLRRITVLGLPLIGSHLSQFAIQLTDTVMLGRYDIEVLAAQVLAATFFFILLIFGSGFGWAVMPLVAEAAARGDETVVRRATRMALWLTGGFALACLPLLLGAGPILRALGQAPALSQMAADYLWIQGWSIVPALGIMVLKSTLAGIERTQVVLWATVAAVVVNALANYALIFGNWGAPELGIRGAAIASLVSTALSCAVMVAYTARAMASYAVFANFWRVDRAILARVFRLGLPIGLTSVAEVSLFSASSVMMGWLGAIPLAAHGIALNITSAVFMVHIGLSNVATIRAGNALGRGDGPDLRRGARAVVAVSLVFALVCVALFLLLPRPMIAAFLDPADPAYGQVMRLAVAMLAAAALFQLVDALQVMALGLLRGVQDTQVPMLLAVISYWVVGVPVAYLLGFTLGLGGIGVWLGLAAGLAVAGVLMMRRFTAQGAYVVERSNGSDGYPTPTR
ncbi:multidrug resistance protein, MATE family [Palleronia salina]|uniref:Multidrug-efflux transporter n=1 Tax=Palleronia salina TaxID=313368 RepID=A0A1M6J426_9RHOB|nr:MATE family efflux transporter [Palleronia salina]SHJ41438.1 multidrug resistance protein, MATE family [Palleronia salina]